MTVINPPSPRTQARFSRGQKNDNGMALAYKQGLILGKQAFRDEVMARGGKHFVQQVQRFGRTKNDEPLLFRQWYLEILEAVADFRISRVTSTGCSRAGKSLANILASVHQSIAAARLKERIKQLCEIYGIQFLETEKSYTSKVSFLDSDSLPKYGEKPESWEPSGKRLKRGLYRAGNGWEINADCNGACNIIRKVAMMAGFDLTGISRGDLTAPLKFKFWIPQESQSL